MGMSLIAEHSSMQKQQLLADLLKLLYDVAPR
jgi:hypothetical protein